jgi:hypothetical protein
VATFTIGGLADHHKSAGVQNSAVFSNNERFAGFEALDRFVSERFMPDERQQPLTPKRQLFR